MQTKEERFKKIVEDIKNIKIQGAADVAKAALTAYKLMPTELSKTILLHSRPTEPMMHHVLELAEKNFSYSKIAEHFEEAQNKINKSILSLIKNKNIIFIHCHSTNVIKSLIYCKKKGKNFEVYNTETRPLFQGRKTAKDLASSKIKITMSVESAIDDVLSGEQGFKKPNFVFLGADALLKEGIINKIGSELIAKIALQNKIPVYIIADSWKFTKARISLEQRDINEVWDKAPKGVKIKNPAFEFVNKKYISGIITEFGLMKYDKFVNEMY